MKYSIILFFALVTGGISDLDAKDGTNRHLQTSLTSCLEITLESKRLQCYDKLAKSLHINKKVSSTPQPPELNQIQLPTPRPKAAAKVETTDIKDTTTSQTKNVKQREQDFGKKPEATSSSISSRLKGEFKKWKKGQKLVLENGQVWVVKRANTGYKKLQNPLVTITEDLFGGFTAQVEGLNATAKVRRIK